MQSSEHSINHFQYMQKLYDMKNALSVKTDVVDVLFRQNMPKINNVYKLSHGDHWCNPQLKTGGS